MKKVTTNITSGQIVFIVCVLFCASFMFFYLGAKFGRSVFEFDDVSLSTQTELLPNEALMAEIQEKLESTKHEFIFHDVLVQNKPLSKKVVQKNQVKAPVINTPVQEPQESEVVVETKKEEAKPVEVKPPVAKQIKTKEGMIVKFSDPTVFSENAVPLKPDTKFHIQLGGFPQKESAIQAANDWNAKGVFAKVVPSESSSGYKIQIGQFTDINSAMLYQKQLSESQSIKGRIVYAEK